MELESLAGERGAPVFPSMLLLDGYSESEVENTLGILLTSKKKKGLKRKIRVSLMDFVKLLFYFLEKFKLPEEELKISKVTAPENKENCGKHCP